MKREEAIKQISDAVLRDRQNTYGPPENSFSLIADLWSSYLSRHQQGALQPHDVAAMMMLVKIARIAANPNHTDNWVDAGGYAVCGAELIQQLVGAPIENTCSLANETVDGNRKLHVDEAIALSRLAHKMRGTTLVVWTPSVSAEIERAIMQPQSFTYGQYVEFSKYAADHGI